VRKHALAYQAQHGGDLETAALRVFGNAEGAYGANVNLMIDNAAGTTRTSWPRPTRAARASPTAAAAARCSRPRC
jgi:cobalamin biosynthesis Mg chelatase CobN